MKKIAVSLFALLLLSATACQETPAEDYVINKSDQTYLQEEPKPGATQDVQFQSVAASTPPSTYSASIDVGNDAVIVTIDATVIADIINCRSIYSSEPAPMSQDLVDRIRNVLLPGIQLYNPQVQRSKTDIMQELELMAKTAEENRKEGFDVSGTENAISALREELAQAPDTVELISNDGKYQSVSPFEDSAPSDGGQTLNGAPTPKPMPLPGNYSDRIQAIADTGKMKMAQLAAYNPETSSVSYFRFSDIERGFELKHYEVNESDLPSSAISYADARKMAEDTVQAMGLDYLSIDLSMRDTIIDPQDEKFENNYYAFVFTRKLGDVSVSFVQPMISYASENEVYAKPWPEEFALMKIDDSGIIAFELYCPTTIAGIQNENATLLPFEDIIQRFDTQMKLSTGWMEDEILERNIKIDTIRLGMARISTSANTFAYVPAWDFIGTNIDKVGPNDGDIINYKDVNQSYMTINAVDGSIISRESLMGLF